MNAKKLTLTAFILVVLAHWYVPAKMILDRETVLSSGTEYKFRTAPLDPSDPFRGKYITLRFNDTRYPLPTGAEWNPGEDAYVSLTTDREGFATIRSVSKKAPHRDTDYVKAKVNYVTNDSVNTILLEYPFDRFYMEEAKAPRAERVYNESLRDTTKQTYALVSIKGNTAVLKDVLIDGISIRELAKKRQP